MGVYSEIKHLVKELNDSKIKQRRSAGEKLQNLLSQPEVRRRLLAEVSVPHAQRSRISIAGARRTALAELWRWIIQSAVSAVQSIVDGKSRVTEADLIMPYNLIRLCDMKDDERGNNDTVPYNLQSSKLDKKTTRCVFEYCMEMLDNNTTADIAVLQLLQMLGFICSRHEYVAHFKQNGEISAIMEEVERWILPNEDDNVLHSSSRMEHNIILEAGKIFESIIKTTTSIGIGIELLLPGCVKLVADWCNANKNKGVVPELPQIINGLSIILQSNPEQSIAPLSRHGRSILSFTKKIYKSAVVGHRTAMNKYFLRHL
jgi:hypothetical protein